MRSFVLYLLFFATLLPTVSQWGIIAHYQLNRDYIARVLCENRSKPQLHCDGTCYLAKKLKAQQDKQDKETTERVQHTPVLQLFYELTAQFQFRRFCRALASVHFADYGSPTYSIPPAGLFHPPQS